MCPSGYDIVSYQDWKFSDVTTSIYHVSAKKIAIYLLIGWVVIKNYSCANVTR